jgi:hypothetical protein
MQLSMRAERSATSLGSHPLLCNFHVTFFLIISSIIRCRRITIICFCHESHSHCLFTVTLTQRSTDGLAGFSPAREVVDMHRLQAPWIVDPALFVRVFADAIQDEEVPPSPEVSCSRNSAARMICCFPTPPALASFSFGPDCTQMTGIHSSF